MPKAEPWCAGRMDHSEGEKPKARPPGLFQARGGGKPSAAHRRGQPMPKAEPWCAGRMKRFPLRREEKIGWFRRPGGALLCQQRQSRQNAGWKPRFPTPSFPVSGVLPAYTARLLGKLLKPAPLPLAFWPLRSLRCFSARLPKKCSTGHRRAAPLFHNPNQGLIDLLAGIGHRHIFSARTIFSRRSFSRRIRAASS